MTSFLQRLMGQGRHRATPVQIRAAKNRMTSGGSFAWVRGAYVYIPDEQSQSRPDTQRDQK